MLSKSLITILGLSFVPVILAGGDQGDKVIHRPDHGGWSQPVNGVQARFTFAEEGVLNGTRIITVYLELQNVSNPGPIYLDYIAKKSIRPQLFDSGGHPIPQDAAVTRDYSAPVPVFICLPSNSALKLDITANGYIPKDQNAFIGVGPCLSKWTIKKGDSSEHFLGGTFTAGMPKGQVDKEKRIWAGTIEIPKANVNIFNERANPAANDPNWAKAWNIVNGFKPGVTTRNSIEKYFRIDGGFRNGEKNTLRCCFKQCDSIKIEVKYNQIDVNSLVRRIDPNKPDDMIMQAVSKPYREGPFYD